MATLALAAAGAAVGSAVLPAGVTLLGATLTGATIGAQVGALAGSYVDQALFGASGRSGTMHGPRLSNLQITSSTEGAPCPRVYGRVRLGGQIIWANEIEEEAVTSAAGGSGKGLGGGGGSTTVTYRYFASFAVAVAEGEITSVGRMWADGNELDLSNVTYRVHTGTETQLADDLIVASVGPADAPAYRGLAYVVFERLELTEFGNRLPQLSFEVYRDLDPLGPQIRGVVMIPGSGEFVYEPTSVTRSIGAGSSISENVHTLQGETDWHVSLDQMAQALPNVVNVSLVTSWFGSDLRAGHCTLKPAVDAADKATAPQQWGAAGLHRATARLVSSHEGRPAYGGTPSDASVVAAIKDLRTRGYQVTLTPFILMDVPLGNGLPDPYGAAEQTIYPWRGRITCDPAPGVGGTVDKTGAAAAQINAFCGSAQVAQFSLAGETVVYSGPEDWGFRRMVLHYAHLAKAAGGVDAFVIGTELRGLTQVRDASASYPFVAALMALAQDVKAVLGAQTKVTYAADWSEYFGHQPADGSGDVLFHLDPLWASSSIDAVGVDLYWPLSDWRHGRSHLDYLEGARSPYDLGYLAANVVSGEGFDWYYESAANRDAQVRTPITDGSGKPWVYRFKDMASWWSQPHFNRPGGIEVPTSTAWVPQSKPIWLMEMGCPAVDLGANQPNVFVDPKSAENALPYYSRGVRDDLMQRQYIRALIAAFDTESEHYVAETNPVSIHYAGRMVDLTRMHVYAWDARPFPAFPENRDVWSDSVNWRLGHWLNGRISSVSLAAVVGTMMRDFGHADFDADSLNGVVPGYAIDRVMSARDALQPLSLAYFFDAIESGGKIVFRHRADDQPVAELAIDELVEDKPGEPLLTLTRGQETELPASTKVSYIASGDDYRQAVAESRRLSVASVRVSQAELAIVLDDDQAGRISETWLHETWVARERAQFALPPTALAIEPGDALIITVDGEPRVYRVSEVGDNGDRRVEAHALDPSVYEVTPVLARQRGGGLTVPVGQPLVYLLDLPQLPGDESERAGYAAARQVPWPGGIAIYASAENTGFSLKSTVAAPATVGRVLSELSAGPEGRFDYGNELLVEIEGAPLTSASTIQMLAGRNALAVKSNDGEWEIIQFLLAELTGPKTYRLSGLLRAQGGTEAAMHGGIAAGAPVVVLDQAVKPIPLSWSEIGAPLNWRSGPTTKGIGDASYGQQLHAFRGIGLRPLSPVHVRSERSGFSGADVSITWTRRTRVGGDSWEASEVPLGESDERYEVDILDGGIVKRTLYATAPAAVYAESAQIADFGSVQASYSVRVFQVSPEYGRGAARDAQI